MPMHLISMPLEPGNVALAKGDWCRGGDEEGRGRVEWALEGVGPT